MAGTPLSLVGGLPPRRSLELEAAAQPFQPQKSQYDDIARSITPSLASILRPQAAYRWLLPSVAAITPQYVESILRGAIAGNHVQAWELFDLMIDTDPEIASCIQEYIEGIVSKRIMWKPFVEDEDEEPSDTAKEKLRVVRSALKHMRPDSSRDENGVDGTIIDISFSRFHGQSLVEIDWTKQDGSPNILNLPGLGKTLVPRATWWVHPVCYAWGMDGVLGLRADFSIRDALASGRKTGDASRIATATKNGRIDLNTGLNLMSNQIQSYPMVEPPAWNWLTSQPRPSMLAVLPDNKFITSVFKSRSGTALIQAVLRQLSWWWLASNFCSDYLLNYAQLFGVPFRKATYKPGTSDATKAEVRQFLQSCGSTGWLMVPDLVQVDFENAMGSAGSSPQAFLHQFADSQKRKVILHQTMTGGGHDSMGKGGGKAFGQVEDDTKSVCIQRGADFVAEKFEELGRSILKMNYGLDDGDMEAPECSLVDVEVGGLADAQRDQVLSTIVNVPASYLHRKYGLPKVSGDDTVAGVDEGTLAAQAKAQQEQQEAQHDHESDMQSSAQDAQVEVAKHNAKAAQANAQAGGDDPESAEPTGQDEGSGTEARNIGQGRSAVFTQLAGKNGVLANPVASSGKVLAAREAIEAHSNPADPGRGCLMAMAPGLGTVDWAVHNIEPDSLAGNGIEDEPHVTIYYGFGPDFDPKGIAFPPLDFTLGCVRRFVCPDYDVLVVEVESPDAMGVHQWIDKTFQADLFPSQHAYKPHLTLAYVKTGSNTHLDESEVFKGQTFTADKLVYSWPDKTDRLTIDAVKVVYSRSTLPESQAQGALSAIASGQPAGSAEKSDTQYHQQATLALHETIEPMLDRIQAIAEVTDVKTRKKLMQKFLKDHEKLTAAMAKDDSISKAVTPGLIKKFIEGMKK